MTEKEKGKRKRAKVGGFNPHFFLLPFAFCLQALAAGPTTQPAAQVRAWFNQLADPTASVREEARERLMGMTAADLPTLKRVAAAAKPLKPAQRAVLRPIVEHLFKSGIAYEPSAAGEGFLGVTWSYLEWDLTTDRRSGVIITECEQGFPAYRLLKPGDIIKGIENHDHLDFEENSTFQYVIRGFQPGETIVLKVQRDGQDLRIPIVLRPRPAGIETLDAVLAWRQELQEKADQYWNEHFARIEDGPT